MKPILQEENCPLASLVVLFYKHEKFVEDTVAGALGQTYPNLEIIFSDDNSPDGTFEAVKKAVEGYQGPHKIILNRNEKNLGLVAHVNRLLFEMCHGEYIFLNGGDDVSLPERVSDGVEYFRSEPTVTAVCGSHISIDGDGNEGGTSGFSKDSLLRADDKNYLKSPYFMTGGAALAFRKEVLDSFGRLSDDCQTEDSVLRFRAILLGPTLRSSKLMLKYRIHDNNLSRDIGNFDTGKIAAQYRADLAVAREWIAPDLYRALDRKISHYTAIRRLEEKEARSPKFFRPLYELAHKCLRAVYLLRFI